MSTLLNLVASLTTIVEDVIVGVDQRHIEPYGWDGWNGMSQVHRRVKTAERILLAIVV